jgi:hypothetical protein
VAGYNDGVLIDLRQCFFAKADHAVDAAIAT